MRRKKQFLHLELNRKREKQVDSQDLSKGGGKPLTPIFSTGLKKPRRSGGGGGGVGVTRGGLVCPLIKETGRGGS